jgi:hypothetical protein
MLHCPLVSILSRREARKQSLEFRAVIGMPDMAQLMNQHVLHKLSWQEHEQTV